MGKDRSAQLVIVVGFLVLHLLFRSPYFLYVALAVGLLSLVSASAGRLIVLLWQKIAHALGWINSRIILSLVFFLLLTPIAVLNRIFGSSPIPKYTGKEESHFKIREHQFSKKDLEELW